MKYFIYCRKSQEAEDRQVMSLASQIDEIHRLIDANPEIEIAGVFEEAMSAKAPGRPKFNEMMEQIEKGKVQGIIAWHPDRLARNSIDGGRIIFALDQAAITDLKFCSYSFENSAQGKFMLNIIFGYSKYYSDNLSDNVKRGLRAKLKQGWRPNQAPIGYKNCKETGTVVPDQKHFRAIQQMFRLLLTGHHTAAEIHRITINDWGYTTPVRKTQGGKKPALSTIYKILANPFYAGYIKWNGELTVGKHKPVISKTDFERAQKLLGRADNPRPVKRDFTYAGLFKCGACGLSVTAEHKRKPSGREYTYYHCTRVHRSPKCNQPSIEEKQLEAEIITFLDQISLPQLLVDWLIKIMKSRTKELQSQMSKVCENHAEQAVKLERQLSNLTDLRIRELVTDEEFEIKRRQLEKELHISREQARNSSQVTAMFEPAEILHILFVEAKNWFPNADNASKRKLLQILCSNQTIMDKKALLTPKKLFSGVTELRKFPYLCGDVEDVRTATASNCNIQHPIVQNLFDELCSPETQELLAQATELLSLQPVSDAG